MIRTLTKQYLADFEIKELRGEAEKIAEHLVMAYIEHDHRNFKAASDHFKEFFIPLFEGDSVGLDKINVAANAYTLSLFDQDRIENNHGLTTEQKLAHEDWEKKVKSNLEVVCNNLNLDPRWAYHTTEFFKFHGILRNEPKPEKMYKYQFHVSEASRILTIDVTGDVSLARMINGLYETCIASHDMHDMVGLELGFRSATEFVFLLLLGKNREKVRNYIGMKPFGREVW